MSRAAKEAKAQAASDAVGDIAETALDLFDRLDKFFADNGEVVTRKFEDVWSGHTDISRSLIERLKRLSADLAPPDDCDPAAGALS